MLPQNTFVQNIQKVNVWNLLCLCTFTSRTIRKFGISLKWSKKNSKHKSIHYYCKLVQCLPSLISLTACFMGNVMFSNCRCPFLWIECLRWTMLVHQWMEFRLSYTWTHRIFRSFLFNEKERKRCKEENIKAKFIAVASENQWATHSVKLSLKNAKKRISEKKRRKKRWKKGKFKHFLTPFKIQAVLMLLQHPVAVADCRRTHANSPLDAEHILHSSHQALY